MATIIIINKRLKSKKVINDIKQKTNADTPKVYTQSLFNVYLDANSEYQRLLKPSETPNKFNIDPGSNKIYL